MQNSVAPSPVEPDRPEPRSRVSRRTAAVLVGVLWTAGMLWASPPTGPVGVVIVMAAGALFGVAWAWLFGSVMRRIGVPVW
ncbi:hypothetical protein CCR97_23515 [Rhodoplanes elegans]|uniref:Uncharacterized protein n=1 Tax=Rhodoplanes elegans TaxID=29408 RepID=A0A327K5H5_9BRAD|nr:hypothetical protein [Rhodoplanes elegans]MBK5961150.1 hypothetical protein [Rhodoplanes elegans]RAI33144.1 hypothetical protein CH338_23060 [Rhodoplanes elegans]